MLLEIFELTVSKLVFTFGGLLTIFAGFLYFIGNKNRVLIAKAARTLGTGIFMITVSIPLSIPNQLLANSNEITISGAIILSIFLGLPLIAMGLASYIGLSEKAHQILNPTTAEEKLRYYSPILK